MQITDLAAPTEAVPVPVAVDAASFRAAMRRFAAACTVVATVAEGKQAGLTATAVCSLTADPAGLLVCINKSTYAHNLILRAGLLSVNVLSHEQVQVARRFAGMVPGAAPESRFDEGNWEDGVTGVPVLRGAMATFECVIKEALSASTHSAFLCEVVATRISDAPGSPLVYFDGRFASLA